MAQTSASLHESDRILTSPAAGVLETASAVYDRVAVSVSATVLALMVVTVAVQVFFRYVVGHPLTWSEELATWLFGIVIFIGATVSIRHDEAPALRVLVDRLSPPAAATLETITEVIALAISLAILWNGALASQAMMSAMTPAIQVPSGIPLLILPIAGFGLSLHYAAKLSRRAAGAQAAARLGAASSSPRSSSFSPVRYRSRSRRPHCSARSSSASRSGFPSRSC